MRNRSKFICQEAVRFLAETKKNFRLQKPTRGVSFDTPKEIVIPAGHYIIIDDDSRTAHRYIIANKKDQELYAINKTFVP